MKKLRIIVDQDEVQAGWVAAVIKRHNEKFGTNHKREDVTDYWKMETLLEGGVPFIKEHFTLPGLYENLDPIEGAIEGMKELHEEGHDLVTASSIPSGISWDEKRRWITKHIPFFNIKNFKAMDTKWDITGDVLIDDAPHHINDWAKTGRWAFVFDSPWNQGVEGPYIHRVFGWKDTLRSLRIMAARL